jgi:hypothetical protein
LNHTYTVGEMVGPNSYTPTSSTLNGFTGRVWKVTAVTGPTSTKFFPGQSGCTGNDNPCQSGSPTYESQPAWCTGASCSFTNGGATFTLQGWSDSLSSVFLVKLQ